jgi:branched-chain amino acid transport system permease protein
LKDLIHAGLLGLAAGGLYAMLATGIVVAFRGSGVINFSHGALAMYSTYTFDELSKNGHFALPWFDVLPDNPPVLVVVGAVLLIATAVLGRFLRRQPKLALGLRIAGALSLLLAIVVRDPSMKLPNLPVRFKLVNGVVPTFPAFLIALVMAVLLGLGSHFLVFRPLRNAPPLGKVIGSVGIMLYLQAVAILNFGTDNRSAKSIVPITTWRNFLGLGKGFQQNKLWIVSISIILGALVWAFYQYTRFGLATRAAAANEKGAIVLGYSPQRLAASSWVLASVLAAIAGILIAPITGLDAISLTLFVIPALGAALVGGLSSVPIAVAAGIALGVLDSGLADKVSSYSWFPAILRTGIKQIIPLLVVIIVLYFRGNRLPIRGTVTQTRLPKSPEPKHLFWSAIVPVAVVCVLSFFLTGPWELALTVSLSAMILMLSYVVLTGYVGQISLAQLGLAGCAAFAVARFASNGKQIGFIPTKVSGPGLPFPVSALLGILVAVVVGVLIGLPALRIRGVQLAVVTIAASLALQEFFFKNKSLAGEGAGAASPVPPPKIGNFSLSNFDVKTNRSDRWVFTVFLLIVLTLVTLAVANLRRSATGRRFLSVRANERAAAAAGIDVARTKLLAFGIASAIAGIGGVMLAYQQGTLNVEGFGIFLGITLLAFAYLGGITSVSGALIGGLLVPAGLVVKFFNYHFTGIDKYASAAGGVALIFQAIKNPEGISLQVQNEIKHKLAARRDAIAAANFGGGAGPGALADQVGAAIGGAK